MKIYIYIYIHKGVIVGTMEKKMETTIVYWGYIGFLV